MPGNRVRWMDRALALTVLAAVGCGDDAATEPEKPDAGFDSAAPLASAQLDGSSPDAQPSASPSDTERVDATQPGTGVDSTDSGAADSGDASGPGDTASEPAQALLIEGVRADVRRTELVLAAYCKTMIACTGAELGFTEAQCLEIKGADYQQFVDAGDPVACLDAQLDFYSCIATAACDRDEACEGLLALATSLLCPMT